MTPAAPPPAPEPAGHARLVEVALLLSISALALVVARLGAEALASVGDVILVFFLAWLLAFAMTPLAAAVERAVPRLPRAASVGAVYLVVVGSLLGLLVQASASLVGSISNLLADAPNLRAQLASTLEQLDERAAGLGLDLDLAARAPEIVATLEAAAGRLVEPLQAIAVASVGVLGNVLVVVILSIYVAIDRAALGAFLLRLVPAGRVPEARRLAASVRRSFGGFLRTQLVMGVVFAALTATVCLVAGLPYADVATVLGGLLHAIPFFGPFVSWAPPVAIALVLVPGALVPVALAMGAGWFVTMNLLQPRLMAGAVGLHPIVVLGAVVVGSEVAGIAGAVFGIPIAAVAAAAIEPWLARRPPVAEPPAGGGAAPVA